MQGEKVNPVHPELSVIIPVYNEGAAINDAISHLLHVMSGSSAEIIVVDGDSRRSTVDKISFNGVKTTVGPKGRGPQMNAGAALADGDILLFLHADTILPDDAADHIRSSCSGRDYAGGAFRLGIDSAKPVYRLIEKMVSIRSRVTRIPYGDQGIFIKKQVFYAMGGFKNIPIMEDIDLMLRIRKKRGKIILLPSRVKTSPRRWEKEGVLVCTLRNWVLSLLFLMGTDPKALKKYYP